MTHVRARASILGCVNSDSGRIGYGLASVEEIIARRADREVPSLPHSTQALKESLLGLSLKPGPSVFCWRHGKAVVDEAFTAECEHDAGARS